MKATDERYTPTYVLDVIRAFAKGQITLDPCTTPTNRTFARRFFTKEDDGLSKDWTLAPGEVLWMNPPYSRGALIKWVNAVLDKPGIHGHSFALLPCDLGSKAGQLVASTAAVLCFPKGRIKFIHPDGVEAKAGAKQPSVIAYWGRATVVAREHLSKLGVCR